MNQTCSSLAVLLFFVNLVQPIAAQDENPARKTRSEQYTQFAIAHDGDAGRGEILFNDQQRIACVNCHSINGIEKSGPNLDGIADKYPRRDLIKHIIEPNSFIQPGYETVKILTHSDEVVTGRMRLSTRLEVRLLQANGKLRSVKRENIADLRSSPVSMMPEDLIETISQQDFVDLIAYLETLHSAELHAWRGRNAPVTIPSIEPSISIRPVHLPEQRFENPVWVCEVPGKPGHLIVLEHQLGRAILLDVTTTPPSKQTFLDLSGEIAFSANQGFMCLAFHPKYIENGKYYAKYEVKEQGGRVLTTVNERIASDHRLSDSGQPSRRLLAQEQPAFNHNGGCLAFGPDGMLYIAFGDGGPQKDPPGYSQNPRVFHGSMLRIDVDSRDPGKPYAIPPDNPFVALHRSDPQFKAETWAFGFREPWRFSFDSLSGDLWLGDVGQVEYEEVCLVQAGKNYGWNVLEGFAPFSEQYRRPGEQYTDPVLAYPRSLGVSVTGGYVYRGDPSSSFYGAYIFGDYESRRLWALKHEAGGLTSVHEIGHCDEHIASFGTNAAGDIFLVGYEGTVFQLDFSEAQLPSPMDIR